MDNKYHIKSLKKNKNLKIHLILKNSHNQVIQFFLNVNCKFIGGNITIDSIYKIYTTCDVLVAIR